MITDCISHRRKLLQPGMRHREFEWRTPADEGQMKVNKTNVNIALTSFVSKLSRERAKCASRAKLSFVERRVRVRFKNNGRELPRAAIC